MLFHEETKATIENLEGRGRSLQIVPFSLPTAPADLMDSFDEISAETQRAIKNNRYIPEDRQAWLELERSSIAESGNQLRHLNKVVCELQKESLDIFRIVMESYRVGDKLGDQFAQLLVLHDNVDNAFKTAKALLEFKVYEIKDVCEGTDEGVEEYLKNLRKSYSECNKCLESLKGEIMSNAELSRGPEDVLLCDLNSISRGYTQMDELKDEVIPLQTSTLKFLEDIARIYGLLDRHESKLYNLFNFSENVDDTFTEIKNDLDLKQAKILSALPTGDTQNGLENYAQKFSQQLIKGMLINTWSRMQRAVYQFQPVQPKCSTEANNTVYHDSGTLDLEEFN